MRALREWVSDFFSLLTLAGQIKRLEDDLAVCMDQLAKIRKSQLNQAPHLAKLVTIDERVLTIQSYIERLDITLNTRDK